MITMICSAFRPNLTLIGFDGEPPCYQHNMAEAILIAANEHAFRTNELEVHALDIERGSLTFINGRPC